MPLIAARTLPLAALLVATASLAQQPPASSPLMQRINSMVDPGSGVWTPQQITTMNRLRDAALSDPYATSELQHLTDNIGPRLSGSPQAQQAVEYVAAEMRALGADRAA
jgi:carboxypeptidase Q